MKILNKRPKEIRNIKDKVRRYHDFIYTKNEEEYIRGIINKWRRFAKKKRLKREGRWKFKE